MKQVTKLMINEFKLKELGYDFMGYCLQEYDRYTFHHLIIPKRDGGKCERWNGSILCGETSHPYIHLIESKDYEIFQYITKEMIEMNKKEYLDIENLKRIHDLLNYFEREYHNKTNKKGDLLIKEKYITRVKL